MSRTLGLVASASGGVERIRHELVEPLMADGWQVAITLTPTAGVWLRESGEADVLAEITGYPVRVESRLPTEKSGHPQVTCYAVVPASANTVAKLALAPLAARDDLPLHRDRDAAAGIADPRGHDRVRQHQPHGIGAIDLDALERRAGLEYERLRVFQRGHGVTVSRSAPAPTGSRSRAGAP